MDEWTGWQVNKLFVLCNRALHCRDRRPRLSAQLPLCVIPSGNIFSFWGAWGGFRWLCSGGQTRASVPILKQALQSTRGTYCNSKFKVHNSKLWLVLLLKSINKFFAGTFLTRNTQMARSLKAAQSSLRNMGIHRSRRPCAIQNSKFTIQNYD